jgi:hypothetical protein
MAEVGGISPSSPTVAPPVRAVVGQTSVECRRDRVQSAIEELGVGVRGSQTHGLWVKTDGTREPIRSGSDTPGYHETKRALAEIGGQKWVFELDRATGAGALDVVIGNAPKATLSTLDVLKVAWVHAFELRGR